jgi:hypothetical protein
MHMRLVKRPILLLIVSAALGLAACGGGDDEGSDDSGSEADDGTTDDGGEDDGGEPTVDPEGADNTFVVDSVLVPASGAEASMYALDIDDDGQADNALGMLLGTIAGFLGDVDIQGALNQEIAQGGIILLANLKATDLADASGVGLYFFLGANADPAPCANEEDTECGLHLQGDATFEVAADSPTDAVVIGENAGGSFSGGPGDVTIQLSLADGADPVNITLVNAKAEAGVAADALSAGKLGGAITVDSLNNDIFPAVALVLEGILAEDGCDLAAPECCPADTTGATIIDLLDENEDCTVTGEEIAMSDEVNALVNPDLDLDPPEGDGTFDAISLGVGFTAVPGGFTPP